MEPLRIDNEGLLKSGYQFAILQTITKLYTKEEVILPWKSLKGREKDQLKVSMKKCLKTAKERSDRGYGQYFENHLRVKCASSRQEYQ